MIFTIVVEFLLAFAVCVYSEFHPEGNQFRYGALGGMFMVNASHDIMQLMGWMP